MGAAKSKSVMELQIETKTLNKTVTNIITTKHTSSGLQATSLQNLSLSKFKAVGCTLEIEQIAAINAKTIQSFSDQSTEDFKTDMKAAIEQEGSQKLDQSAGFLSLGTDAKNEMKTKLIAEVDNIIETNVSKNTLNEMLTTILAKQELASTEFTLDPCGLVELGKIAAGPPPSAVMAQIFATAMRDCQECTETAGSKTCKKPVCKINQNIVIDILSQQIAENISKSINSSQNITEIVSKLDTDVDQSTQGAGDAIGDVARGVGEGIGTAAEGVGTGVGTAAEGVGTGVGSMFKSAGAGLWIFLIIVGIIILGAAYYKFST